MKKLILPLLVILFFSSCVTKGKYNAILDELAAKEKQQIKLEKQLENAKNRNTLLSDSAAKIGG